jgi:hypothetical protein
MPPHSPTFISRIIHYTGSGDFLKVFIQLKTHTYKFGVRQEQERGVWVKAGAPHTLAQLQQTPPEEPTDCRKIINFGQGHGEQISKGSSLRTCERWPAASGSGRMGRHQVFCG